MKQWFLLIIYSFVLVGLGTISLLAQANRTDTKSTDSRPQPQSAVRLPCVIPVPKPPKPRTPKPKQQFSWHDEELSLDDVVTFAKSRDDDCDGVSNHDDNCREVPSKNLTDSDGDGWGDVCDKISSDIRVRMFATLLDAKIGARIKFSIVVTNNGPIHEALGISLVDVFPPSLRVRTIEATGAECEGMADEEDGGLLCDIASLPVGKSATIIVHTTARRAGIVRNTAKVENGIGDLRRKDNQATLSLRIRP